MRNRCLYIALAISLCQAGLAQDLAKKINFQSVAKRTDAMLASISEESGIKLTCSKEMNLETLVVRVENVTVQELLDHIAKVTVGKWTIEKDGSQKLEPFTGRMNSMNQAVIAELAGRIREDVQKQFKQATAPPAKPKSDTTQKDGSFEMRNIFSGSGAGSKLVARMLTKINATEVAKLLPGYRMVYSSAPTRMQTSMSIPAEWLNEYVTEQNKAAAEYKKNVPTETPPEGQLGADLTGFLPFDFVPKPIESIPVKVNLAIGNNVGEQFSFGSEGYDVTLTMFDADGKIIGKSSGRILQGGGFMGMVAGGGVAIAVAAEAVDSEVGGGAETKKPETPKDPIKDGPITLSEMSKLHKKFGEGLMTVDGASGLPKEFMDALAHPEKVDPLAFEESDSLISMAEKNEWNLVAAVPDSIGNQNFGMIEFSINGEKQEKGTGIQAYYDGLKKRNELIIQKGNGWFDLQAKDPIAEHRNHIDRYALATLIANSVAKTVPTLDDIANYAAVNPAPNFGGISATYLGYYCPSIFYGGMTGGVNWDMLRLYGTFTSSERELLANGSKLPIPSMNARQSELVRKMIFGTRNHLTTSEQDSKKNDSMPFGDMFSSFMGGGRQQDYRNEPTEALPNGIPTDAHLILNMQNTNFLIPVPKKGDSPLSKMALGVDEIAIMESMRAAFPNEGENQGFDPTKENVKVGERQVLNFTFRMTPGVSSHETLNYDRMPKDSKAVPWNQIPSSLRSQIDQKVAAMKNSPWFKMMQNGGGAIKTKP